MNFTIVKKQCNLLLDKGIEPKIILMSEKYYLQAKNEFPDMFIIGEGIHKNIFLFDGRQLGIYTDPIDDYFVKVCGD